MGERTPLPGQHPYGNGQGSVRPQTAASLILVLCNQTKQAMLFVRDAGGEINAVAERKKIPKSIKLKRGPIGSRQRLDKGAGSWIVIIDESIPEVANPEFALNKSKAPRRVEIAV